MPPRDLQRLLADLLDGIAIVADGVATGRLNADQFQAEMARRLFEGHVAAALIGGETRRLTPDAAALVVKAVQAQLPYLDRFADEIAAGGWLEKYHARAALYAGSIKPTFWQARAGGLEMPYYPAQGTDCMNNCRCAWRIDWLDRENLDADCTWVRGVGDSCDTCISRESVGTLRFREGVLV